MGDRSAEAILKLAQKQGVDVTDDMFELADTMPGVAAGGSEVQEKPTGASELYKHCHPCTEAGHGYRSPR